MLKFLLCDRPCCSISQFDHSNRTRSKGVLQKQNLDILDDLSCSSWRGRVRDLPQNGRKLNSKYLRELKALLLKLFLWSEKQWNMSADDSRAIYWQRRQPTLLLSIGDTVFHCLTIVTINPQPHLSLFCAVVLSWDKRACVKKEYKWKTKIPRGTNWEINTLDRIARKSQIISSRDKVMGFILCVKEKVLLN